jgi:hypothetical protein
MRKKLPKLPPKGKSTFSKGVKALAKNPKAAKVVRKSMKARAKKELY